MDVTRRTCVKKCLAKLDSLLGMKSYTWVALQTVRVVWYEIIRIPPASMSFNKTYFLHSALKSIVCGGAL